MVREAREQTNACSTAAGRAREPSGGSICGGETDEPGLYSSIVLSWNRAAAILQLAVEGAGAGRRRSRRRRSFNFQRVTIQLSWSSEPDHQRRAVSGLKGGVAKCDRAPKEPKLASWRCQQQPRCEALAAVLLLPVQFASSSRRLSILFEPAA